MPESESIEDLEQLARSERLCAMMDDYIRTMSPQERERIIQYHLAEARGLELESGSCDIVTPEDIILMKLEWRKETKSQKQWDNALSVMRVQRNRLDWKYMYEQAEPLGVTEDLIRMRDEAGI